MSTARRLKVAMLVVLLAGATGVTAAAANDDGGSGFGTRLQGYQEVPAISVNGGGTFRAAVSSSGSEVRWQLTYDLPGSTVLQSHIHFGQKSVNGGISVFLCSNLGNGPAGTQACPSPSGTISGTFRASDVIGPAAQGISAGEYAELLHAIRAGVAYANVHTAAFPGGAIRGQLSSADDDQGDDD